MVNTIYSAFRALRAVALRLLVAALAGFGLASASRAQTVNIPDPALQRALAGALNWAGPIDVTNMLTLTNFAGAWWGFRDLTGMETASNLVTMDISGNAVANLAPIAHLAKLTELHLNQCSLVDLSSLAGLTNLVFLDLGGNSSLSDLTPLAGLTQLNTLQTPYNRVTNPAPLAGLTNLTLLDIGWNRGPVGNSITNAAFLTNLKKLNWLSLFYLDIHDLSPLAGLTALTNANVSWNYSVTNVSALDGLTNMVEFYATADGLTDISFVPHMPRLNQLDFGYDNVTDLAPLLGHDLIALWAYGNPLTNAQLVTNFTDLQVLHMDGTGMTDSGLDRLTRLQVLSLDNNPTLTNLASLSSLTNLTSLSLGQLALPSISGLAGVYTVTELHLHDDTGVTNFAPLLGLTNLQHLDVNNCPAGNFAVLGGLTNLTYLEMNANGLEAAPFLAAMVSLNRLDINNNHFRTLASLTNTNLYELNVNNNDLYDLSALLSFPYLNWQLDVTYNLLDLSPNSAAWNVITNLQANGVPVQYQPQNISPSLTLLESPQDRCVATGTNAYFEVIASSSAGPITYQWLANDQDLPGQTNAFLLLVSTSTNQAGAYRVVLSDSNGSAVTAPARLYVGDPHCGNTVYFAQQPANTCAAPGEDATFSASAVTTLTNLYYQWLFNGTNLDGQTQSNLLVQSVNDTNAGTYQVVAWDDGSNVVSSAVVQLLVVDQVTFSDPVLGNLVTQQLVSQNQPPGNPMQLADLDHLNYLDLSYSTVTNLDGLRCARYLTNLRLSGNSQRQDFRPLAWVQTLQDLYLDGCGLYDISFLAGLFNLNQLGLDNNQIISVSPLAGLTNLSWLSLNRNGGILNSPALAGLTNLSSLALYSDGIHDLGFVKGMAQLMTLDLGADGVGDAFRNQVQDISPLADKALINWLSLAWNQVTNVSVLGTLPGLQWLYLSGNPFDNLFFVTHLTNLVDLSINYSAVTNLTPLAASFSVSGSLDVGYIATTNLQPVAGLTNVQYFYGGGNHAGSLAPVAAMPGLHNLGYEGNDVADLSPLAALPALTWANLEANLFTDATPLAGETNLNYLYLAWNQIHELTPLAGLTNLLNLSLAGNGFTNLSPLGGLRKLNWLTANSNHIQDLSAIASLTNLGWTLDLSQNEITDISPLTNLHALTWLGIWGNRITSLPWLAGLPSLSSLDLHANRITNVTGLAGMPQIYNLNLDNNRLTAFPALPNLVNLQSISARTNLLTEVSGFSVLTNLHWLYVEGNNLTTLQGLNNLPALWWLDVRWNLLDTNSSAVAWQQIDDLQQHGTGVDYIPQNSPGGADRITAPQWLGAGGFRLTIVSPTPRTFEVQRSPTLANPLSWSVIGYATNSAGTVIFVDPSPGPAPRYYRLHQL